MTDSSSSLMQYGFQDTSGDENYQNEATTTTESKRTREFFESENDMDVDIVRNEDSLGEGEGCARPHDVYVYSDGKRLRRMWENGNIDLLFNSGSSSTSMLPSPEKMTMVHRGKRNRVTFHKTFYEDPVSGERGQEDEVGLDDYWCSALKKLKMSEDYDLKKVPMSRRLPDLNDLDEGSDVDFSSVNQVLNELYRERCFRRNVDVYSALADSLSTSLKNPSQEDAFTDPKNGTTSSDVKKIEDFCYDDILDSSGCSSMPP